MIIAQTPCKYTVLLFTTGAGDGFERDRNQVSWNGTVVIKVLGDGCDLGGCIREQSAYIEHVK